VVGHRPEREGELSYSAGRGRLLAESAAELAGEGAGELHAESARAAAAVRAAADAVVPYGQLSTVAIDTPGDRDGSFATVGEGVLETVGDDFVHEQRQRYRRSDIQQILLGIDGDLHPVAGAIAVAQPDRQRLQIVAEVDMRDIVLAIQHLVDG